MANMKKVTGSKGRGKSFLPSPGEGGKLPKGTAGQGPKPKPAPNSGASKPFPASKAVTSLPICTK